MSNVTAFFVFMAPPAIFFAWVMRRVWRDRHKPASQDSSGDGWGDTGGDGDGSD